VLSGKVLLLSLLVASTADWAVVRGKRLEVVWGFLGGCVKLAICRQKMLFFLIR